MKLTQYKKDQLKKVEDMVLKKFLVSRRSLYTRKRDANIIMARLTIWDSLNADFKWTTREIASVYNRDHSTIVKGLQQYR